MSYARFGEDGSDVYLFAHVSGGVNCCGCWLATDYSTFFYDRPSLMAHLVEHRDAGHTVPDRLFDPDTYEEADFDANPDTSR